MNIIVVFILLAFLTVSCGGGGESSDTSTSGRDLSIDTTENTTAVTTSNLVLVDSLPDDIDWMATGNAHIVEKNALDENLHYITNTEFDDYKPTYSPDGTQIAFFRVVDYGNWQVEDWKTKICVINVDGTGYKELTTADHANWNPVWTRDGSNKIVFTKLHRASPHLANIYWVDPNGEVGDEQRISAPYQNEFAYSSLLDGRILARRWTGQLSYQLLTPDVDNPSYEPIQYASNDFLHKMTISPSETKVAYMKVRREGDIYEDAVIAYADFDAHGLSITNEKNIVPYDSRSASWYPAWTEDENYIVYAHVEDFYNAASQGDIRAYHLDSETTAIISESQALDYRYPNVKGVVK